MFIAKKYKCFSIEVSTQLRMQMDFYDSESDKDVLFVLFMLHKTV